MRDLGSGVDTAEADGKARLPWRKGDMMLTLRLQGGATLTLRASGEELQQRISAYDEVARLSAGQRQSNG